jgi:5-methylcytosine-specific restriction endonuclease McrA
MTATSKRDYKWHEHQHLYQTKRWRMIRKEHIMREPLCVMCGQMGRIEAATVVDHITPHKGNEEMFYAGPFQSLCATHHNSTKARIENSGVQIGGDVNGQPIDNDSHWYR